MSLYRTGTVSIVNNASVATGVNTLWLSAGITPGMSILVVDGIDNAYAVVAAVTGNGNLTLAAPWPGGTVSNVPYSIAIDFTPNHALPLIDETAVDFPALYNAAMTIIDGALP